MAKKKDELTWAVLRSKEIFDYYNLINSGADKEELRKANNRLKLRIKKLKEKHGS